VVLRFHLAPERVLGADGAMTGVEFARTAGATAVSDTSGDGTGTGAAGPAAGPAGESQETIDAGLLLTSIGYGGAPVPGLPFDAASRTVPNRQGRVIDPASGEPIPGTYVTGWIKRGPSGFLGTNRSDSQETVRMLVEDFNGGLLASRRDPRIEAPHPAAPVRS
jgi:ferredoxin--NADP+ reductase